MKSTRGLVWIGIGAIVYAAGLVWGRPIVVRGTSVPWGLVVIGVGLLIMAWDWRKAGKDREDGGERKDL